jgi:hypothetical protein
MAEAASPRLTTGMRIGFWRISIRGALCLLSVVAIGAAVVGWGRRSVQVRAAAISRIETDGGHVVFSHEGMWGVPGSDPPGPRWLASALGDRNALTTVESITFYCNQSTPAKVDWTALVSLKEVRILHLETPLPEAELYHLEVMTSLEELSVRGITLTEKSVHFLRPLHELRRLRVARTTPAQVQDELRRSVPTGCSISTSPPPCD